MKYREEITGNYFIFDADDEEPNCMVCNNWEQCEHLRGVFSKECCGPFNGWKLYERWKETNTEDLLVIFKFLQDKITRSEVANDVY